MKSYFALSLNQKLQVMKENEKIDISNDNCLD